MKRTLVPLKKTMELPKAVWMEINAERAQAMLERLETNRRLISNHVAYLMREMAEGRWKVNGDTIRFSGKRLMDGQHRLHAVIQANATIWALVVEELSDDAFDTIDTGRVRGPGDILSLYGYHGNPFMIAATARFIWYHDHKMNLDTSLRLSNHQILEVVRRNSIIPFLADYMNAKKGMRASPIVAALTLIDRKAGRELTMFFAEKLTVGAELKADDPVKLFRDKWMLESKHRSSRGERATWIAVLIKTYNAWLMGKKSTQIERYQVNEKFPEVQAGKLTS